VFGVSAAAALFGCAALAGEVGVLPPAAWFTIVMGVIVAAVVIAGRRSPATTSA
jgi:hypothetical protein